MSTISALEVFRQAVLSPEDATFVQEVSTLGRSFFDTEGQSLTSGQDDITVKTTVDGARYRDISRLNYYHLSVADINVKKFGRKIINTRDRLEDGPTRTYDVEGLEIGDRVGKESLEKTLDAVSRYEYGQSEDSPLRLVLDEIDDVEYPMLFPGKRLLVLRASAKANRFESGMLQRMSSVASLAIKSRGPRIREAENRSIVDTVPLLDTREQRPDVIEAFKHRVCKQLLPIEVELTGLEFHTKY